jgi:hypothetical protein
MAFVGSAVSAAALGVTLLAPPPDRLNNEGNFLPAEAFRGATIYQRADGKTLVAVVQSGQPLHIIAWDRGLTISPSGSSPGTYIHPDGQRDDVPIGGEVPIAISLYNELPSGALLAALQAVPRYIPPEVSGHT